MTSSIPLSQRPRIGSLIAFIAIAALSGTAYRPLQSV